MATKFKVLRDRMTPEQRAESEAMTVALLAEMSLDELRQELAVSQDDLAGILGIKQAAVSKQFRRPDWHVSTLKRYIAAFGGELELVAKFPDREIRLTSIGDDEASTAV